MSNAYIQGLGL